MDKDEGACSSSTGLGSAEAPEPPSRLRPAGAIPSAETFGFTGTQKGCERAQLNTLKGWLGRLYSVGFVWMRNGDCVGADAEAAAIWRLLGNRIYLHPPSITNKRAFLSHDLCAQAKPYLDRNRAIADGSRVLIATPAEMVEQQRGGTWSTIRYADRSGLPHIIIFPDGSYVGRNGAAQVIEARRAETAQQAPS